MDISRTCSPSGAMPVQRRFLRMESESTVMVQDSINEIWRIRTYSGASRGYRYVPIQ